eukprot:403354605
MNNLKPQRIQIKLPDRSGLGSKLVSADTSKNDISRVGASVNGDQSMLNDRSVMQESFESTKYQKLEDEFINLSKVRKMQQDEAKRAAKLQKQESKKVQQSYMSQQIDEEEEIKYETKMRAKNDKNRNQAAQNQRNLQNPQKQQQKEDINKKKPQQNQKYASDQDQDSDEEDKEYDIKATNKFKVTAQSYMNMDSDDEKLKYLELSNTKHNKIVDLSNRKSDSDVSPRSKPRPQKQKAEQPLLRQKENDQQLKHQKNNNSRANSKNKINAGRSKSKELLDEQQKDRQRRDARNQRRREQRLLKSGGGGKQQPGGNDKSNERNQSKSQDRGGSKIKVSQTREANQSRQRQQQQQQQQRQGQKSSKQRQNQQQQQQRNNPPADSGDDDSDFDDSSPSSGSDSGDSDRYNRNRQNLQGGRYKQPPPGDSRGEARIGTIESVIQQRRVRTSHHPPEYQGAQIVEEEDMDKLFADTILNIESTYKSTIFRHSALKNFLQITLAQLNPDLSLSGITIEYFNQMFMKFMFERGVFELWKIKRNCIDFQGWPEQLKMDLFIENTWRANYEHELTFLYK